MRGRGRFETSRGEVCLRGSVFSSVNYTGALKWVLNLLQTFPQSLVLSRKRKTACSEKLLLKTCSQATMKVVMRWSTLYFINHLNPLNFSQFLSSVPLGSIPELPAKSCAEIKASEGEQAVNGHYWLDPYNTGKNEWTNCYLETKGLFVLFFNNYNADVSNNSQI